VIRSLSGGHRPFGGNYLCRSNTVAPLRSRRAAYPQLSIELGSGDAIPFGDSSFDVVLSFDVLEHIRDSDRHVAEVRRVLKNWPVPAADSEQVDESIRKCGIA